MPAGFACRAWGKARRPSVSAHMAIRVRVHHPIHHPPVVAAQTQNIPQHFIEHHAMSLCADAGPASGGPPRLLLTRVMAISVGSAMRCV